MKKVLVSALAVLAIAFVFVGVTTSQNAAGNGVTANSVIDPVL